MNTSKFSAGKTVYADLRNDFMFKKAFGQKDIMIPFLNDILETDKIRDIEYRNVEQLGFDAESAKIANFTTNEQMSYIESQKMKYDYENVLEYAVEQATEKGFSEGEAKGRKEGKEEGRAEGEAMGRAEGVASVISKLLKSGFSADVIASATGLSIAEIQKYC